MMADELCKGFAVGDKMGISPIIPEGFLKRKVLTIGMSSLRNPGRFSVDVGCP